MNTTQRLNAQIRRDVATAVIAVLEAHPDELAYYRAHADGDADFVFIEEEVSSRLSVFDYSTISAHRATCGLVFRWLKDTHGVEPPRWYRAGAR